jgi:hypothetical protein
MVNGDRWNAILASAACLGSARVSRVGFSVLPKRSLKSPRTRDGFASTRDACATRKIFVNHVTRGALVKKEMPDRASLAIRHLVDVSNQTKTELCVTVVFFEL